jgi:hypothetical protein
MNITEEWLKEVGFKWHQFERQPGKQWLLWLGGCVDCGKAWRFSGAEDFGIELAHSGRHGSDQEDNFWMCWFRGDSAGRYHRFIHVRHLRTQDELIALVTALTGFPWNPENHLYGSARCPKCGDAWRAEEARRIDLEARKQRPWYEIEKDDSRGGALPEHMQGAIDGGKAK